MSLDEEQRVWLFLHSGSRGVGNKIAMRHIAVAAKLCKQWWIELPDPDLAYLVEGTDQFWAYLRDLRWAQKFALLNCEDTDAFIDEIPAAYKDIDQVMADATDLVEVRHTLHQVVNVKDD